jgi:hypothetical protein
VKRSVKYMFSTYGRELGLAKRNLKNGRLGPHVPGVKVVGRP